MHTDLPEAWERLDLVGIRSQARHLRHVTFLEWSISYKFPLPFLEEASFLNLEFQRMDFCMYLFRCLSCVSHSVA